jgi:hypothetical protein
MPTALLLSFSSVNVLVIMDNAAGMIRAAAIPCTARNNANSSNRQERAAPNEVIRNRTEPVMKIFFLPARSASFPPAIRNPPYNSTYKVCSHCTSSFASVNSSWIRGMARLTMAISRASKNTLTEAIMSTTFFPEIIIK